MIAAAKSPAFNAIIGLWLKMVMRRRFHNIYLLGTEHLRTIDNKLPVVGCVNHTNWWDGFVLYILSRERLPHDIYLAMEEQNLRRYPFFTWMGVFGINLSNSRADLPALRYAIRLLRAVVCAPRLIWVFVQGRLTSPQKGIESKPGATFLARCTGAQILPLALRYEWLAESRPSVFVQIGHPLPAGTVAEELSIVLNQLFAQIEPALDSASLPVHETLFRPRMSVNRCWDLFIHILKRRKGQFNRQNL